MRAYTNKIRLRLAHYRFAFLVFGASRERRVILVALGLN